MRWRGDGKELLYFEPGGRLMSAEITTAPAFKAAVPHLVFEAPIAGRGINTDSYTWDMTADAKKFLINAEPEEEASTPITLVQNWVAGLKH